MTDSEEPAHQSHARIRRERKDARKRGLSAAEEADRQRAREQLDDVYLQIMSRAPEHDFDPSLDRVRRVMELLGDPQKAYQTIHITGTNGKTSTARMIESLLREHGLRTGRYTSPHLTSVTERIAIDGEPISPRRFVDAYDDVLPYVELADRESVAAGGPRMSFFEVLTVMAFAAFADAPIDVAVVEVGMGGEWDATNVVDGNIAVIAPVALDHQRWLGSTVEQIARTKAGIIKPGATAVVSRQLDPAEAVIEERAQAVGARLLREGQDLEVVSRAPAVGGQLVTLQTAHGLYEDIFVPLFGAHQAQNALLALTAVEELIAGDKPLQGPTVEAGFAEVTSPGRLEVVRTSPTIVVDAAHNPAGAEVLVDAVQESFRFQNLVGVVAIMGDKAVEDYLGVVEPLLDQIVVTRNSSPRSDDLDHLEATAVRVFGRDRVHVAERLDDAIAQAVDLVDAEDRSGVGYGEGVLITGSVVTAADARVLLGHAADPGVGPGVGQARQDATKEDGS